MKRSIRNKKILVFCLAAVMAACSFGCSGAKTNSETEEIATETIDVNDTKLDLTFDYRKGPSIDATEAKDDDSSSAADATTAAADSAADGAATTAAATTAAGQPATVVEEVTQYVNVTDAAGQQVTDAAGQSVTEATVVGTREVDAAAAPGTPATDAPAPAATDAPAPAATDAPAASYTPAYDTCKAYWLDMTQYGDYMFNGEFLVIQFQVNQDIPDGSYPVTIAATDIASWDLVKFTPVTIDGEVAVNTTPKAQADAPADEFSLKLNSVSCKQGDTVTVVMDLQNNPGFCGFVIDIQYDANAMSIVEASGGKDFNSAIKLA